MVISEERKAAFVEAQTGSGRGFVTVNRGRGMACGALLSAWRLGEIFEAFPSWGQIACIDYDELPFWAYLTNE